MATTSDISRGNFLRYNGELVVVLDYSHITPGKGNAIYTVKSRNVKTGKQSEIRFRSGEKIELVRVEVRELQFLYLEGEYMICMNQENYEQLPIPLILLGDTVNFLGENMIITVKFDENQEPVAAILPQHVELVVTYSEPGIKGDSSSKTLKTVEVEGGTKIQVPLFIESGEKIRINTETREYIERVKV